MPSAGFEPAISSVKRMKTYALDSTATGIGKLYFRVEINHKVQSLTTLGYNNRVSLKNILMSRNMYGCCEKKS
jgi:hypothetical protein